MSDKKYGLIVPGSDKSQQPAFQASRNVFGEDSDSDNDTKKKPVLLQPSHNIIRQAKISREKAVKEDPTVYQYDEVYDSMKMQKEIAVNKNKQNKQPQYIENLMKAANKRKIENERRIERQIQKEREKEGDEFADKEVFVTSAYKKKLEEMKLEEEKEKRQEYLESIGDVTKQKDLGGFYRYLYEQKLGSKKNDEGNTTLSGDLGKEVNTQSLTPEPKDQFKKKADHKLKHPEKDACKRNYRKRKSSTNVQMSEGEIEDSDDEINRINISEIREGKRCKKVEENIDADSDFSIDETSEEEDNQSQPKKPATETKIPEATDNSHPKPKEQAVNNSTKQNEANEIRETKIKVDIWKKRTVGEIFEQSLKRYYERKALRGY